MRAINLKRGLEIMCESTAENVHIAGTEHDILYLCGIDDIPSTLHAEMEKLGFTRDDENETWCCYT